MVLFIDARKLATTDSRVLPSLATGQDRRVWSGEIPEGLVMAGGQSFFAQTEQATGAGLPQFVRDEFDAYLEYGILAPGFLRLRCADCGHDKLLAFSCKRRGFCPSCGARRMSQSAAHLVDNVIPRVPVRQWVLCHCPSRCAWLAGRTTGAGNACVAGRAPRDHAPPA